MMLQATMVQTTKSCVYPNGRHGNVLKVGVADITAIGVVGQMAIVSYVRNGKPKKFATAYEFAELADEQPKEESSNGNELQCEQCGGSFKGPQALAGHRKHCSA